MALGFSTVGGSPVGDSAGQQAVEPVSIVTGVTLSPSNVVMSEASTQQFTWQVNGSNSPLQDVILAASDGSISSAGLFTRPPRSNALQFVTIKATSVQDEDFYDTATVTILALPVADESLYMAKLDASQFINLIPIGQSGKRSLATLVEAMIDDLAAVRRAQTLMAAKLDADPGVTATDFVADATVPDDDVILGK